MEFDNDRIIRPTSRIEIFYWILIFLFYPLINFFTFFPAEVIFLPILLLISVLVFPFYLLYAKAIIPGFLFTRRYVWFGMISFGFYAAIQLLLSFIYSFFHFDENTFNWNNIYDIQALQPYFIYSPTTFMRESLWCFVNMIFAANISFLKKSFD